MAEVCPYCSAAVRLTEVLKMNSGSVSVLDIKFSRGVQKSVPVWDVECDSCRRKFVLAKFSDPEWLIEQIEWLRSTVSGFRNIFGPELSNERFIKHITGYAYRNKKKNFDICFKYNRKRGYVSCVKSKGGYTAVSVEEISFG